MDVVLTTNKEIIILFKLYIKNISKDEYYEIHKLILSNLRKLPNNIKVIDLSDIKLLTIVNTNSNDKELILKIYIKLLSQHHYISDIEKKLMIELSKIPFDKSINGISEYINDMLTNFDIMDLIDLYQELAYYITNNINDNVISNLIYDKIIQN